MHKFLLLAGLFFLLGSPLLPAQNVPMITKGKNGDFQLLVHNKPFLMLGGELSNSATPDKERMEVIWPRLAERNINTVLAPVYWELLEPVEGKFDFTLVEAMITQARASDLKLVLLWFGTWKNSMSCYAPEWIKKDFKRFPRTLDRQGHPAEIVSPFSENVLQADIRAYTALLDFVKKIDAAHQTVVMIQVENEIGQLPDARDFSLAANKAYHADVPQKLLQYLQKNKILPHVQNLWDKNGRKISGSWETVFGKGLDTEELFIAWFFADFTEKVASAGKKAYNLPVFVNCALNRPNVPPGKYPSGGPLPHLIDVWHAAAPSLDMLSPDVYHGDFRHWLALYDRPDNPVFLPEIKMEPDNAAQVFYTLGRHKSLGYCPFAIELAHEKEYVPLSRSYQVLDELSELILTNRMKTDGVFLDNKTPVDTIVMGDYQLVVSHVMTLPWTDGSRGEKWTPAGGIIIQTAPDEFWIGGTSITATFKNIKKQKLTTGILSADIALKKEDSWKFVRLNGDQTHQGRHIRIGSDEWQIQKVRVYDYQ